VRNLAKERPVVFLCWSGTRSRQVAAALEKALRDLNPDLDPFSSPGIEKGTIWFEEVGRKLDQAEAAIVCLTPENARTAWIHFEAGAVAAKMASRPTEDHQPRVYPFLFRMEGAKLEGPLVEFQATAAVEQDVLRLASRFLPAQRRDRWKRPAQQRWWLNLQADLRRAEDRPLAEILPDLESLFRRKTFDEPLNECVDQAWPARWHGARDTHQRLKDKVAVVAEQCRPHARELLQQLVEAVDGYAMALELLLKPARFPLRSDGRRDLPQAVLETCERRRREVKRLLSGLADPRQAPVFEEAPRFQGLETFGEKKATVHRFEAWLARAHPRRGNDWRLIQAARDASAGTSRWHFDRIAFYLVHELEPPDLQTALDWVRLELERTRAEGQGASHMPLTYCLGPLRAALAAAKKQHQRAHRITWARSLLKDVGALAKAREVEGRRRGSSEPNRLRLEAEALLKDLPRVKRPTSTD
jgi:hypothetical protein